MVHPLGCVRALSVRRVTSNEHFVSFFLETGGYLLANVIASEPLDMFPANGVWLQELVRAPALFHGQRLTSSISSASLIMKSWVKSSFDVPFIKVGFI